MTDFTFYFTSISAPSNKNRKTTEGFQEKHIVAVSFFKTVLYTHILNTYLFH